MAREVEKLKRELINSIWLAIPRMEECFILETAASDKCIGGVLKQKQDGKEVIVRFCSRNLIQAEQNYTTLEKEALAIIYTIKTFKNYLHQRFPVRTDHKSLVWLYKVKNPQGRIARRLMFLSDLDFVIEYKKGCSNLVADFVSRVQLKKNETERSDISNVVLEAHQITGHSCPGNTYDFLLKQGVREGIAKARVKDILKTCTTCLKFKKQSKFKSCPTRIDGTFLKVGIDCIGPLPKSAS